MPKKETYKSLDLAKKKLVEIGELLSEPQILIGGIAVNNYIPHRNSVDVDLICSTKTSQKILDKLFPSDEWDRKDRNDDPGSPHYIVTNKVDKTIVFDFGPRLDEGAKYKHIDWKKISENPVQLTYQNKPIANIFIPNPSYLAYMKLISFHQREDAKKRIRDLKDFVNLTNDDRFSISLFYNLAKNLDATGMLIAKKR